MSRQTKLLIAWAVILLIALIALSACGGKYTEQFKDAPRSGSTNTAPADTIEMPDGFSNLATKCDHGNRLYVAFKSDYRYAAIAVVPHDGSC